jgi:hypothetical protein
MWRIQLYDVIPTIQLFVRASKKIRSANVQNSFLATLELGRSVRHPPNYLNKAFSSLEAQSDRNIEAQTRFGQERPSPINLDQARLGWFDQVWGSSTWSHTLISPFSRLVLILVAAPSYLEGVCGIV